MSRVDSSKVAVWAKSVVIWQRLRGETVEEPMAAYIERLKSRKAQSGDAQEKKKAAVKFEAGADVKPVEAATVGPSTAAEKPKPAKKEEPKKEEDADFATRLMRAKKKAAEDRDKDKPK